MTVGEYAPCAVLLDPSVDTTSNENILPPCNCSNRRIASRDAPSSIRAKARHISREIDLGFGVEASSSDGPVGDDDGPPPAVVDRWGAAPDNNIIVREIK